MLKFSSPDIFSLKLPSFEMNVAQPMNKTLGQWCLSLNSRTLSFIPVFVSLDVISQPCLFILSVSCQSSITEKQTWLYQNRLTLSPEVHTLVQDFLFITSVMNQKPLKWQCFLALNQGCSISHSRISRRRVRKSKRFRDNVQAGTVDSEKNTEASPKKKYC